MVSILTGGGSVILTGVVYRGRKIVTQGFVWFEEGVKNAVFEAQQKRAQKMLAKINKMKP